MSAVAGVSGHGHGPAVQASLSLEVASKVQDQQKQEGQAAVSLIEGAGEVSQQAPASHDGSGHHVNVYA